MPDDPEATNSWTNTPSSDPTQNVLQLVRAAIQRQDDLRLLESTHVREVAGLRADHARELRIAESARIDAIRAVDVGAVNRAAEVSAQQATTLAAQVAISAEALRTQVAATATAATVGLAAALEPIQKDIADLRRAQYEAQGVRSNVSEVRTERGLNSQQLLAIISVVVAVAAVIVTLLLSRVG